MPFSKRGFAQLNIIKAPLALALAAAMAVTSVSFFPAFTIEAQAKTRTLTLSAAIKSALAVSEKIEALDMKLDADNASLKNAIKSVAAKKHDLATFRWSPLFSFKFPSQPNLSQAYEFQFKPISAQFKIDKTKHRTIDTRIAETEKVQQLFVTIVSLEDSIKLNEERQKLLEETIKKNEARLLAGEARQGDIDKMQARIEALDTKLLSDQRNLEEAKKKLSKAVGFDVNTGFEFEEPFVESTIKRNMLNKLIEYTLDRNETYYEASLDAELARISLNTNYNLMRNHYSGSDMNIINSYCRQALAGEEFNAKAFKKAYDQFIDAIDRYWRGHFRILFIKIPKELLKGSLDGIRYVEDDAYSLYESAMDYRSALKEKANIKEEISAEVTNAFNNYVSVKNVYQNYRKNLTKAEAAVDQGRVLNQFGDMTYEEFEGLLKELEDAQNELYNGLKDYTSVLYSFDRLTSGGITAILSGTSSDIGAVGGGQSIIDPEIAKGAYYYIEPIVSQTQFILSIHTPDDYKYNITDFELVSDGVIIGDRTASDSSIRHLALTTEDVDRVSLRLYDGDRFLDEVEIDASAYYGPLDVTGDYNVIETPQYRVGIYEIQRDDVSNLTTITLKPDEGSEIKGYRILTADGAEPLKGQEVMPITKAFTYLHLMESDLETLVIEYYGDGESLLYKGYFDVGNMEICRNPE